ncbi:DDE-type integrase/transposase/recombinase [Rhizobium phaseoli]|uniref:DDE-type integrase/transposase/recombinase n=1 Tax=Rhizobium phaseoli TaxID=396 RepID=UPI0011422EA1|nr:DDE-type integrase/transposase/recombinase [Rhizobium phaseoli]
MIVQLQDGSGIEDFWQHSDIREMLSRPVSPLVEYRKFSDRKQARRRATGIELLRTCTALERAHAMRRFEFVSRFLRMQFQNREARRAAIAEGREPPRLLTQDDDVFGPAVERIAFEIWHEAGRQVATWKGESHGKRKAKSGEPFKDVADFFSPSSRSVSTWIKRYRDAGDSIVGLIDQYDHSSRSKLPDDIEALVEETISKWERQKSRGSRMAQWEQMVAPYGENPPISYTAFCARIRKLPAFRHDIREFGDEALNEWKPGRGGFDVILPFELLQMDEWTMHLATLLKLSSAKVTLSRHQWRALKKIRLTVVAVIDVASRCIVAMKVFKEKPSTKAVISTLAMVLQDKTEIATALGCETPWDIFGLFDEITTDNGSWYHTDAYHQFVMDLGAELTWGPTDHPEARPNIEGLFKATSKGAFDFFSGKTFSSVEEKGDYDPFADASVLYDKAIECLFRWALDVYHRRPHQGAGMFMAAPRDEYFRLSREHGVTAWPTGELAHVLGIHAERVMRGKGLRFLGIYYSCKPLHHAWRQRTREEKNEKYLLRIDAGNLASASVLVGNEWYPLKPDVDGLEGFSLLNWVAFIEKLELYNAPNVSVNREVRLRAMDYLREQGELQRLDAALGHSLFMEDRIERLEARMDRDFDFNSSTPTEALLADRWVPNSRFLELSGIAAFEFKTPPGGDESRKAQASRQSASTQQQPGKSAETARSRPAAIDDRFNK